MQSSSMWVLTAIGIVLLALIVAFFSAASRGPFAGEYSRLHSDSTALSVQTIPNQLSVLTYNIGFGYGLWTQPGTRLPADKVEANLQMISRTIREAAPDIACIQEADWYGYRTQYANQAKFLFKQGHFKSGVFAPIWNKKWVPYPISLNIRNHTGTIVSGLAIFSRFPIAAVKVLRLSPPKQIPTLFKLFYLERKALLAEVQVTPTQSIWVINVHLEPFDKEIRQKQAQEILNWIHAQSIPNPVMICGDFNATYPEKAPAQAEKYMDFRHDFQNDHTLPSFKQAGFKDADLSPSGPLYTYPSDKPWVQLDYVVASPPLQPVSAQALPGEGSDHLPVYTRFN